MNRQARREAARKAQGTGRHSSPIRRLSLWEKGCIASFFSVWGLFLLVFLASMASPQIWGRCLKCVITGNQRCTLYPRQRT